MMPVTMLRMMMVIVCDNDDFEQKSRIEAKFCQIRQAV